MFSAHLQFVRSSIFSGDFLTSCSNNSAFAFLSATKVALGSSLFGSLNSSSTVFHIISLAWSRSAIHHISTLIYC